MAVSLIQINGVSVAEVTGGEGSINSMQAILDLIGDIAFTLRCDRVLVDRSLIDESFFDLKSGFAGELTQKFSTYRMKLAVTGDFSMFENLALKAFLYESNLGKTVRFVSSRAKALEWLSQA